MINTNHFGNSNHEGFILPPPPNHSRELLALCAVLLVFAGVMGYLFHFMVPRICDNELKRVVVTTPAVPVAAVPAGTTVRQQVTASAFPTFTPA
jgi:hypothetical protein